MDQVDRVIARTVFEDDGCWTYGPQNATRYPQLRVGMVHRFMYEQLVGPISDGMDLDHLCFNPKCWHPDHLKPVSHADNVARSRDAGRYRKNKEWCRRGLHPWVAENIYRGACRQCRSEYHRLWHLRRTSL